MEGSGEMRDIKFKVWNGKEMKGPFDLSQNPIYWEGLEDGERLLYTGLKDKNGIEIYEGDIFEWDQGVFGFVEFFDCSFYLKTNLLLPGDKTVYKDYYKPWLHVIKFELENELEILGNLYENKELLGE